MYKTGKTVVLATNQLYFVQSADLVIYMSEGRIAEAGPYPKLMAAGAQFATMMKEVQVEEEEDEKTAMATPSANTAVVAVAPVESDKVSEPTWLLNRSLISTQKYNAFLGTGFAWTGVPRFNA